MKTQEELNKLKEEVEAVNEKLHELTAEELEQVTGGNCDFTIGQDQAFFQYIREHTQTIYCP